MLTNILQYLEQTVREVPDKLAFSTGKEGMDFATLHAHARAVGASLLRLGHGGEPVAILMDKHPAAIASFFGVLYAGGYYAALDADMPPARMSLIFGTLSPRVLLFDEKNRKTAERLVAEGIFTGTILAFSDINADGTGELTPADTVAMDEVRNRAIDTDPIYVVFTSGSTGVPKGVAACHHSFKGGVCTNCGARQPKKQKKNIISRFLKKGR